MVLGLAVVGSQWPERGITEVLGTLCVIGVYFQPVALLCAPDAKVADAAVALWVRLREGNPAPD